MTGCAMRNEVRALLLRKMVLRIKLAWCKRGPRVRSDPTGSADVYRIATDAGLDNAVDRLDHVLQQYFSHLFEPGQKVLIKINLNTALPYPASTSPEMLSALLGLFRKRGITELFVGDCSSNRALPTRRPARTVGILDAVGKRARMICFDEHNWCKVSIKGRFLTTVTVPKVIFAVDRIVALANIKSHGLADFSFGLKLGVGFMHPLERYALHQENLREKVAEINLAVQPDVTIIDGRTVLLTGGPDEGEKVSDNTLLIGANPLTVDLEAYRRLYTLREVHDKIASFQPEPMAMAQFRHAVKMGIGGDGWRSYRCIET